MNAGNVHDELVSIPIFHFIHDLLILKPRRLIETKGWLGMTTEMYLVETSIESIDRRTANISPMLKHVGTRCSTTMSLRYSNVHLDI